MGVAGVVLIGLLVLAFGGCVCVFWAARGGPRWARAVAAVTLTAGEVVRAGHRATRKGGPHRSGDGGGSLGGADGGSD
ncbi:hypothetical protein [Streptomyces sp. NPDC047097]|uniref:hypothetical protein n=1 Tax=Streptomyces sp. NPDC047097 TaxID=3155260 RepID=UPI003406BB24